MNCRSKKSIKSTLGIAAVVMLLAGCGGNDIQSRSEDTEKDDALQLQQNIEEQDRAEAGSEEQPEQSGQFGQQGQAEEQGQSGQQDQSGQPAQSGQQGLSEQAERSDRQGAATAVTGRRIRWSAAGQAGCGQNPRGAVFSSEAE